LDLELTILAVLSSDDDSLVSIIDTDTMTNDQCGPQTRRCVEQMLTSYMLRPVSVSFSQEWSMSASDVRVTPKLMYFVRVGPCLHPPGNHCPHGSLQDTDKLDTPKGVSTCQ